MNIGRLAITGSTGKTTTKDMLAHICAGRFKTAKSDSNMNNEIGLPLSVLAMDGSEEIGVFEMGMYQKGEIDTLAGILKPEIGVITNIGMSHIQNFKNQEGILNAKLEISNYMGKGGVLIVNADDAFLSRDGIYDEELEIVKVGRTGKSDFIISAVVSAAENELNFNLEHGGEIEKFKLNMLGTHNAVNASLAAAAAFRIGIPLKESAERLVQYSAPGRLIGKNGMKILDDTYNASPDSMRAALDSLNGIRGIRKIAILGDMNELGERSPEFHREVGEYASGINLDIR
jgi:UDP-N-acetylmuramoyl-tripeptide--D-alanyl-D-alanine ligase